MKYQTTSQPDLQSLTEAGQRMHALATQLFPICRSVTGAGVRDTLRLLQKEIPLQVQEVESGTPFFDWEVPPEWNVRDAYVADGDGRRVIDFQVSNLHLVNGSIPQRAELTWAELRDHLHTLPDHPDWIPFRKCFPNPQWGFCLSQNDFDTLAARGDQQRYQVVIDSELKPGSLTYGELLIPGKTQDEVLISTHICHPSLANDGLSGTVLAVELAQRLLASPQQYTYRFVFVPATIGAITWLGSNQNTTNRIRHGLVLSCLGDQGDFTYYKSRRGEADIDRIVAHLLKNDAAGETRDFVPFGYDQRQYCSPGFDLPMGCLMRTPFEEYPEYHTSADDLQLLKADQLAGSLRLLVDICHMIENNTTLVNQSPKCEPRLGPLGLYEAYRGPHGGVEVQRAALWILNQADGTNDLLAIAERSGLSFRLLCDVANTLKQHNLVRNSSNIARVSLDDSWSNQPNTPAQLT